jgi:hypothetical protein
MPIIGSFGAGSGRGFGQQGASFEGMCATGGTITEDGSYKIHTFTGPGTFTVNTLSPDPEGNDVDYLVVAGGGAGGHSYAGGGGAGGYRESPGAASGYTASPLGASPAAAITVTAQGYPVTVGGGGAAGGGTNNTPIKGSPGVDSSGLGITSTGGGTGGGGSPSPYAADPGGSGGGIGSGVPGAPKTEGSGNDPAVSPPQGNPGGPPANISPPIAQPNTPQFVRSGGGGAIEAGEIGYCGRPADFSSMGGIGAGTGINPSPSVGTSGPDGALRYFAGGGAGIDGDATICGSPADPYQVGGGGERELSALMNTGGGGGADNGNGGSGIVIIRYRFK